MDKKMELLKKLQALAERGVGGEKETAERKLKHLMEKYGIDEECLEEDAKSFHEFKYAGKWQEKLMIQVIAHVMGSAKEIRQYKKGRGSRSIFIVDSTSSQALQIGMEFDFHKVLMAEEMDIFFSAFIHKHNLFGEGSKREGLPTPEELERIARMMEMMKGMQEKSMAPMIEEKEGDGEDGRIE